MELIKPIVKVGNSAGVLLPIAWLNGEAKIELIKKPVNISEDIMKIIEPYLQNVVSVALVGSYARGEQKADSDIDVLIITDKDIETNRILKDKYEIMVIPVQELEDSLKDNALPILPMLKEAKPIMNSAVIEKYKSVNLDKNNLKWHFDTTKSILRLLKGTIDLAKEKNEKVTANVAYPLVLRLRQCYIVESLIKNRKPNNRELLKIIKSLTGSLEIYKAYKISKNNSRTKKLTSVEDAEKVYDKIKQLLAKQKEWTKRKS